MIYTLMFVLATATTGVPAFASDPASWTPEQREQVDKLVDRASVKAQRAKLHEQDAQRAKGVPTVLMVGQPAYPRHALEQDVHGCVIVSFDILPDGKTDQFEVVKADPPGVFDTLAMRMMLVTTFEKPAKGSSGAAPMRHRKAVFVLLPQAPPKEYSRVAELKLAEIDKRRAELRAACESQAP
jgi:TonB family protein